MSRHPQTPGRLVVTERQAALIRRALGTVTTRRSRQVFGDLRADPAAAVCSLERAERRRRRTRRAARAARRRNR